MGVEEILFSLGSGSCIPAAVYCFVLLIVCVLIEKVERIHRLILNGCGEVQPGKEELRVGYHTIGLYICVYVFLHG